MTVNGSAIASKVHHAHPSSVAGKAPAAQSAAAASFGSGPAAVVSFSPKAQQINASASVEDHDGDAK